MEAQTFVVTGTILQTSAPDRLDAIEGAAVSVDASGTITAVDRSGSAAGDRAIASAEMVVRLGEHQRLLPGLIDLHVHAPQWPQLGTGLDLPLERWLFEYTFPLEARYADSQFARQVWADMVPTLLAHGTTTAVYFGVVDEAATTALALACLEHGQRAFVGRVAMDHPDGTPEWYRDPDATTGVTRSLRSIEAIRAVAGASKLVQPIVTPRFAPACTDALLQGLAELADATGTLVQTHCSESDWEHGYAFERFGRSDTEALTELRLARANAVLAHCTHMSDGDFALTASIGAAIAHCPLSNTYFAGRVLPVRRAIDRSVRIGLGTDVAGGAHPGLLPQASYAVSASRTLDASIDTVAAFWLATLGGATGLGLPIGLIEPGRQFDALVVDLDAPRSLLRSWGEPADHPRTFEKIVRLAGPADVTAVWVDGRKVR
jgi:guanine deaminase